MAACAIALSAASVSKTDKEFVNTAATMDMTGANEGQMAQNKASRAEVKDFARMLVQDDSQQYGQLAELAAKNGVSVPKGINTGRIPTAKQLASLNGTRFDQQFARDQIAAEQRSLAIFKHEAHYGQNAELKAFANKMIPVIQTDLKRAEECSKAPKHM
jgi:putative membrane protein